MAVSGRGVAQPPHPPVGGNGGGALGAAATGVAGGWPVELSSCASTSFGTGVAFGLAARHHTSDQTEAPPLRQPRVNPWLASDSSQWLELPWNAAHERHSFPAPLWAFIVQLSTGSNGGATSARARGASVESVSAAKSAGPSGSRDRMRAIGQAEGRPCQARTIALASDGPTHISLDVGALAY